MFDLLILISLIIPSVQHGYLAWPPNRSSIWRYGYNTTKNYNDNALFCGGRLVFEANDGKCGICGDSFDGPKQHEAGGKYASGIITETYPKDTKHIKVSVILTTNHAGYFEFRLCPNNNPNIRAQKSCFKKFLLPITEGVIEYHRTRYYPVEANGPVYNLTIEIPRGIICSQCILQWRYRTGNSWGFSPNGTGCKGCGLQEEYYNCADISIGVDNKENVTKTYVRGNITKKDSSKNAIHNDTLHGIIKKDNFENASRKDNFKNASRKDNLENASRKDNLEKASRKDNIENASRKDNLENAPRKDNLENASRNDNWKNVTNLKKDNFENPIQKDNKRNNKTTEKSGHVMKNPENKIKETNPGNGIKKDNFSQLDVKDNVIKIENASRKDNLENASRKDNWKNITNLKKDNFENPIQNDNKRNSKTMEKSGRVMKNPENPIQETKSGNGIKKDNFSQLDVKDNVIKIENASRKDNLENASRKDNWKNVTNLKKDYFENPIQKDNKRNDKTMEKSRHVMKNPENQIQETNSGNGIKKDNFSQLDVKDNVIKIENASRKDNLENASRNDNWKNVTNLKKDNFENPIQKDNKRNNKTMEKSRHVMKNPENQIQETNSGNEIKKDNFSQLDVKDNVIKIINSKNEIQNDSAGNVLQKKNVTNNMNEVNVIKKDNKIQNKNVTNNINEENVFKKDNNIQNKKYRNGIKSPASNINNGNVIIQQDISGNVSKQKITDGVKKNKTVERIIRNDNLLSAIQYNNRGNIVNKPNFQNVQFEQVPELIKPMLDGDSNISLRQETTTGERLENISQNESNLRTTVQNSESFIHNRHDTNFRLMFKYLKEQTVVPMQRSDAMNNKPLIMLETLQSTNTLNDLIPKQKFNENYNQLKNRTVKSKLLTFLMDKNKDTVNNETQLVNTGSDSKKTFPYSKGSALTKDDNGKGLLSTLVSGNLQGGYDNTKFDLHQIKTNQYIQYNGPKSKIVQNKEKINITKPNTWTNFIAFQKSKNNLEELNNKSTGINKSNVSLQNRLGSYRNKDLLSTRNSDQNVDLEQYHQKLGISGNHKTIPLNPKFTEELNNQSEVNQLKNRNIRDKLILNLNTFRPVTLQHNLDITSHRERNKEIKIPRRHVNSSGLYDINGTDSIGVTKSMDLTRLTSVHAVTSSSIRRLRKPPQVYWEGSMKNMSITKAPNQPFHWTHRRKTKPQGEPKMIKAQDQVNDMISFQDTTNKGLSKIVKPSQILSKNSWIFWGKVPDPSYVPSMSKKSKSNSTTNFLHKPKTINSPRKPAHIRPRKSYSFKYDPHRNKTYNKRVNSMQRHYQNLSIINAESSSDLNIDRLNGKPSYLSARNKTSSDDPMAGFSNSTTNTTTSFVKEPLIILKNKNHVVQEIDPNTLHQTLPSVLHVITDFRNSRSFVVAEELPTGDTISKNKSIHKKYVILRKLTNDGRKSNNLKSNNHTTLSTLNVTRRKIRLPSTMEIHKIESKKLLQQIQKRLLNVKDIVL